MTLDNARKIYRCFSGIGKQKHMVAVFLAIKPDKPISPSEISTAAGCSIINTGDALSVLAKKGLVLRRQSKTDLRRNEITTTAKGQKLQAAILRDLHEAIVGE